MALDMVYGLRNAGTRRDLVVIQHVRGRYDGVGAGVGLGGEAACGNSGNGIVQALSV